MTLVKSLHNTVEKTNKILRIGTKGKDVTSYLRPPPRSVLIQVTG